MVEQIKEKGNGSASVRVPPGYTARRSSIDTETRRETGSAMNKKNFHMVFGLTMLVLGAYGAYDEIYNVMDFFVGSLNVVFILGGAVILFFAVFKLV